MVAVVRFPPVCHATSVVAGIRVPPVCHVTEARDEWGCRTWLSMRVGGERSRQGVGKDGKVRAGKEGNDCPEFDMCRRDGW